jgi:hypothetical protein
MDTSKVWHKYVKWQKALEIITRGTDMRAVLSKSLALAIASTLFTLPYFHYLISEISYRQRLSQSTDSLTLLLTQLLLLFILTFLSAMVGFSFSNRYQLHGLGDPSALVSSLPLMVAGGAVITVLSYFFFDRSFFEISPVSYPRNPLFLLSYPFKRAFTDEIILRFCLVTIAVGLFKSKSVGVIFVSAFAAIATAKYFHFIGLPVGLNTIFLTQLFIGFLANLLLGYLFVARGLLYSMSLGFIFGMKYLIMSWLL